MQLTIIFILLFALAGSLCGNLWLAGELERRDRESEMEWGDPDMADFTWEDEEQ